MIAKRIIIIIINNNNSERKSIRKYTSTPIKSSATPSDVSLFTYFKGA